MPSDPGFSGFLFYPYIICGLFTAVYFNRPCGFISIGLAAAAVAAKLIFFPPPVNNFRFDFLPAAVVSLPLIYIFGTIRENDRRSLVKIRERLKLMVKMNYRLRKITSAQLEINRELEERVTRQRPTLTTLYNQIHRMDSLNLGKSLDLLIETVEMFTGATSVTVWSESTVVNFLQATASTNRDLASRQSDLVSVDDSIAGWVFRNNRMFSIRMAGNFDNLKELNRGHCIISCPIPINKKVWGVLSIEDMPFSKYNHYTEKLVEIIISLAEPALSRAAVHEKQIQQSETDSDTGFPLFSQLFGILDRNIESAEADSNRLSLLILEIANFNELCKKVSAAGVKKIFLNLTDDILMATAGMAEFFMHKSDNQMAVFVPGLDNDGSSLLCLEILEKVNASSWTVDEREINPEIIIGFSSLGDNASDADGLVQQAEHLLNIQKV